MHDIIAAALPTALDTLKALRADPDTPLSDVDVMRAWEADFSLFSHATLLAESIAQDSLQITIPTQSSVHLPAAPTAAPPLSAHEQQQQQLSIRSNVLESLHNLQTAVRTTLAERVNSMRFKPRLYRLAARLSLTDAEIRAFVFIVLVCTGMDGPPTDERRPVPRPRSELLTCRQFAAMGGHHLLHFLSPSRLHFVQGLLEVDEEFATLYNENKFRAPREVLKAIYGCALTLDEAMTLGNSALYEVLTEEPGSILRPEEAQPVALPVPIDHHVLQEQQEQQQQHLSHHHADPSSSSSSTVLDGYDAPSAREISTDPSAVLDLLSELTVRTNPNNSNAPRHDKLTNGAVHKKKQMNGIATPALTVDEELNSAALSRQNSSATTSTTADSVPTPDASDALLDIDVAPYDNDMDYLKDGFEVVQEACKVYNFREKNSEEDRYTNTKRPVEALQREADAKLRKASTLFTRRLNRTKQISSFLPRLELLVEKLKLAHFERMVILTLVGAVLSQSIRKTLRSDPSLTYETGITVAKLLRVHCNGDLRQEIRSRAFFYRNATLIRSGIVTIDVPYNMSYSDLGDFCCELDHMVLDYVAGLHTELEEIMDSARCYSPKVDMDSVILPEKMKDMVLQRAENFDLFRRLRKDVGFDDIVRYGKGLTLFFHGKSGTGKTLFANALASHLKKKLLVVDFNSLNSSKHSNTDAYRIVFREAKIHGAIVFMDECDELFESRDRGGKGVVTVALREMETFDGIMILATNRPQMLDEAMHRRIALSLMFESPDAKQRLAIWKKHVPKNLRLADDVDLKALAIEFELTGGYIKNAIFEALANAVNRAVRDRRSKPNAASTKTISNGTVYEEEQTRNDMRAIIGDVREEVHGNKEDNDDDNDVDETVTAEKLINYDAAMPLNAEDIVVTMEELRLACRLQARGDLKRTKLERRVIASTGLDRLVATEDAMQTLRDIVDVEKVRGHMATRWGFKDCQMRSNCVLIFGPSGAGKSFAARCLGFETGRPLQRIAASELHGSRDGTSHIGDVFRQAAVAGAVVVVEHAEQLLFETSNPESTASPGLELLFHMQSFNGMVVLCCTVAGSTAEAGWPMHLPIPNRVSSLLSYIVILPTPTRDMRLRLWKQLIPKETPVEGDNGGDKDALDAQLEKIAHKYEFTGAKIASCIRRAASAAAMRRNRASLIGSRDEEDMEKASDELHKVRIQDFVDACETELRLGRDSNCLSDWVRKLYV